MYREGKMFKKIGFTAAALFGLLLMGSAKPAKAEVHFGIYLGAPAPAYSYPVDPYAYSYPYSYAAPAYVYPAPTYVAPYYSYGYRDRDHDRREWRQYERRREVHRHNDRGNYRR
jgi:hypothetical protein